jgi:membrane dipeptidase
MLEGGHVLGGDLSALEPFAKRGVASLTVTHFFNKGLATAGNAFPFFPDAGSVPPSIGLSPLGRDLVLEMNRLGMIVDVSHMTSTALADVLAISGEPVIASHSSSRTIGDHPTALYDEHAQEISRRGGLIGIILYPHGLSNYAERGTSLEHGTMRDVIATARHLAKICGTSETLAFGSDYGGVTAGPKEMPSLDRLDVLRSHLLEEFGDESAVEGMMALNAIEFLRGHWRSGPPAP